jgi:hypothetical protein
LSDQARNTTFGRSVPILHLYLETMTLFNEVWSASLNLKVFIFISRMQIVAWLSRHMWFCIYRLAQYQDCLLYTSVCCDGSILFRHIGKIKDNATCRTAIGVTATNFEQKASIQLSNVKYVTINIRGMRHLTRDLWSVWSKVLINIIALRNAVF